MVAIYIQSPKWFVRPRNTDWRYMTKVMPRVVEFVGGCRFHSAQSLATTFYANKHYIGARIGHILGINGNPHEGSYLDIDEFRRSGSNVVLCHDNFPRNADSIPVVWQNSILDPEMVRARGYSQDILETEIQEKGKSFRAAAGIQVSTEAERVRLGALFPDIVQKFFAIPFFIPDAKAIESDLLSQKIDRQGSLRCLFVGHEARRKGLDRVYAAFQRLSPRIQGRVALTVVSDQVDGKVRAPSLSNVKVFGRLSNQQVQQIMRESDVYVMPSYFESYGIVYLEAMAQGTIPIVPNWEVQREIVDYGKAGIVTTGDPNELASIIESLCDDPELRPRLALNVRQRFEERFAPGIVARQYSDLFHRAASGAQM